MMMNPFLVRTTIGYVFTPAPRGATDRLRLQSPSLRDTDSFFYHGSDPRKEALRPYKPEWEIALSRSCEVCRDGSTTVSAPFIAHLYFYPGFGSRSQRGVCGIFLRNEFVSSTSGVR